MAGDIFAFQVDPLLDRYFFGRVVATDTKIGNFEDVFKNQPFSYANLAFFVNEQNNVVEHYKREQDVKMKSLQETHKKYCKQLHRIISTIDSSIDEWYLS